MGIWDVVDQSMTLLIESLMMIDDHIGPRHIGTPSCQLSGYNGLDYKFYTLEFSLSPKKVEVSLGD